MDPIMMTEIKDRDSKRFGIVHPGRTLNGTTVEIIPGERITIMTVEEAGSRYVKNDAGKYVPSTEDRLVTKTFTLGDTAEVGSYNLTYTGTVRKITEKTVTVVEYEDFPGMRKTYRMSIYDFASRNKDFDAEETAKRNAVMMVTL